MRDNKDLPNESDKPRKPSTVGNFVTFLDKNQTIHIGDVSVKLKRVTDNGTEIVITASKDKKIIKE